MNKFIIFKKILSGIALLVMLLMFLRFGFNKFPGTVQEFPKSQAQEDSQDTKVKNGVELFKQDEKPPFVEGEVIIKLKEKGKTADLLGQKYSQRILRNKYALFKLKIKYKLKDEKAVFEDLHQAMEKQNASQQNLKDKIKTQFKREKRTPQNAKKVDLFPIYLLKTNQDVLETVEKIKKDADIEYAQPNYNYELLSTPLPDVRYLPNDYYLKDGNDFRQGSLWQHFPEYAPLIPDQDYPDLWGLEKTQAVQAWNNFDSNHNGLINPNEKVPGEGVTVAVVDTGLDYNHPDIGDIWHNPGEIPANGRDDDGNGLIDDYTGYDFSGNSIAVPPDNDVMDQIGHGTHVSGTIAAKGNNEIGIIGMAPGATIMPVKVFPNAQSWILAKGVRYAASMGADILNNSWGFGSRNPSDPTIEAAIDDAYSLGSTLVFAAGNANDDISYFSPQNHPSVIDVAASDHNDNRTGFSQYGAKIDVAAPGGDFRGWLSSSNSSAKDGRFYETKSPGNSVRLDAVYGKTIKKANLTTAFGPDNGMIEIYFDKIFQKSIDLYSREKNWQVTIPLVTSPAENISKIQIVVSDNRNPASSGTNFIFDDIETDAFVYSMTEILLEFCYMGNLVECSNFVYDYVDQNILSLSKNVNNPGSMGSWDVGDRYIRFRGTSMAAPHVSGLAALILSRRPEYTAEQIRQSLRLSADDIDESGKDNQSGYGRINANQALQSDFGEATIRSFVNSANSSSSSFNLTAKGPGFSSYRLDYAKDDSPDTWIEIENSDSSAENKTVKFVLPAGSGKITLRLSVFANARKIAEDQLVIPYSTAKITAPTHKIGDEKTEIKGSATGTDFTSYQLKIEGARKTETISQSDSRVENGVLGILDGSLLEENQPYNLTLKVQTKRGERISQEQIYLMKGLLPGWPIHVDDVRTYGIQPRVLQAPVIADIDNDGNLETVVWASGGYFGDFITVYRSDGSLHPGWPKALMGISLKTTPLLGDLDNDKKLEIVARGESRSEGLVVSESIYILSGGGRLLAGFGSAYNKFQDVKLADINNDSRLEIIVFRQSDIIVLNDKAQSLAGWPKNYSSLIPKPLIKGSAIGDINGDGTNEIIMSLSPRSEDTSGLNPELLILDQQGQVFSRQEISDASVLYSPVLGDIDNDGKIDIVVPSASREFDTPSNIYIFNSEGAVTQKWLQDLDAEKNTVILTDTNDDQNLEIIASGEKSLVVLNAQGQPLPGWPKDLGPDALGVSETPASGDIDGDGKQDILAVVGYGGQQRLLKLFGWKADGSLIDGYPKPINGNYSYGSTSPSLADLNQDHNLDIVLSQGNQSYLYAYSSSTTYNKNKMSWPMYGHDPQHTNFYSNQPTLDKNCTGNFSPGQIIDCTLTLQNPKSWMDLTNVTVSDVLDSRLQFMWADNNGFLENRTIKWPVVKRLGRGEKKVFRFKLQILGAPTPIPSP
ncbi:MAG TPA: S8 family serine peptidase [Patescibacteria group bacterium]|nr:S8 family serine peptidase [Patescibacteria group bacterium]